MPLKIQFVLFQTTGLAGEIKKGHDSTKLESMQPVKHRMLKVRFNADTASSMQWNFKPHQAEIKVKQAGRRVYFLTRHNFCQW